MQQATRYDNLSTEQLVGVYNDRFDLNYTPRELIADFDNNEQEMRQGLILQLVDDDERADEYTRSHPLPQQPINIQQLQPEQWRGRRILNKTRLGMKELQNIVLNLYRDVVRVKKAISPSGASHIVHQHNQKAHPNNHWELAKRNPQGPDELDNMADVNDDGIPDVVIRRKSDKTHSETSCCEKIARKFFAFIFSKLRIILPVFFIQQNFISRLKFLI